MQIILANDATNIAITRENVETIHEIVRDIFIPSLFAYGFTLEQIQPFFTLDIS